MSWFNVWDGLKNKTCRYLLQRYLGQFLDEKLNLQQFNVELYNGKATITNVALRVEALNELLDAQGWPFEFTDGQVGMLTVSVPWNALMTNGSSIEASDVVLCLRPVQRFHESHESMIESMWSSVSSSLQLAEECMRQEEDEENDYRYTKSGGQTSPIVGLEKFAETIDNVLNRIHAKFSNVTLKLEYPCHDKLTGVALKIHLNEIFYKNETGNEKTPQMSSAESTTPTEQINRLPTYAKHNVQFSGVSIFTQENWVSENESPVHQEDIPILELKGQQNVQIKVKQSEEITGPKICFDVELGAVCVILSPRQLQLLTYFLDVFGEEEIYRAAKQTNAAGSQYFDIQHHQGHQQKFNSNLSHGNLSMWNCEMPNVYDQTSGNFYRNCENYCDSIASSSLSSSTLTSFSRYQRKPTNVDSCAEISKFEIKISAFLGVILHEDILVENDLNIHQHIWNEHSVKDVLQVSQGFFEYAAATIVERELDSENLYCSKNHLFLKLNPIVAEGKQSRNKKILQISTTVSATKVELCEVLEKQVTHLIKFNRHKNCFNGYQIRPEFIMNFSSNNNIQMKNKTSTSIEIVLEENITEFDISIIDRLGSFFAPSPYRNHSSKSQTSVGGNLSENKTEFSVSCSLADVKLRFPIVDVKPLHDPNRVPWWKQNIRSEYLLLRFSELKVIFSKSCLKFYASQMEVFYVETDTIQNHFLSINCAEEQNVNLEEYPQILIDFAERKCDDVEDRSEPKLPFSSKRYWRQSCTSAYTPNKMENDSIENIFLPGEKHELDDFCETTLANSIIQVKLQFPVVNFFLESKQLYEVIYNRLNTDLFMWEPSCPYITKSAAVNIQRQMGQSLMKVGLMDSIYISAISQNDSFCEPNEKQSHTFEENEQQFFFKDDNQEFIKGEKVTIEDDDENESDDDIKQPSENFAGETSHNCSVEIKLGKISGSCFVPVRDNEKHILPQVCGKFLLNLENAKIFLVAGFRNDVNLSYICTQIKNGELYHCGIVPMNTPLRFDHQSQVEEYMQSTIYKIPNGLTKGIVMPNNENDDTDMFSVVIEVKKNPTQRIKRVKITAGIRYTTLRYNPSSSSLYWLNQLIDFLDVIDYPIEGYKPFSILSEMQLHLSNCAIDFRPDNFNYRAVLELFYFSVCSNIIPCMSCCNLRFVLEEGILSLAPFEEEAHKNYPCSIISFIDAKNLVPVLDVGLLDISLRLSDDESGKSPLFDLRCSIHDAHFRTCYDSGSAFAQLIGYLGSKSNNSNDQFYNKEQSLQSSISSESDFFLTQSDQQLSKEKLKKHQERVNILMAEAVQESHDDTHSLSTIDEEPTDSKDDLKLFYFPDENNKNLTKKDAIFEKEQGKPAPKISVRNDDTETLPMIKAEFGEIKENVPPFEDMHNGSSNEEDYCIIADEENVFVNANFGSGSIKVSEDPLIIVDNHFCLPSSSINDPLRTPTNFPIPEHRYTLCEMTVTWHLYGGNDFPAYSTTATNATASAITAKTTENKTAMSETYRQGVFYANESNRLQQDKKPKEKITWKSVGGSNRNHEVLVEMQFTKVRFSYEIYPRHTTNASRQVLVINEIEIRDRLQSSEINKFLYNANTKSFNNRRSQHMVVVKAIHVRPNPSQNNNQECSLRISLSPLRVHIDQDTLEFLTDFFTNFCRSCNNNSESAHDEGNKSKLAATKTEIPVMIINEDEQEILEAVHDLRARRIVNENISLLIDEQENAGSRSDNSVITASPESNTTPIYFREVIFSTDVSIRFDYHGRRVELSRGPIAGLLMGLGQLQCSEIILRKIAYRRGILGFEKVCNYLCKEWLRDIKRNQLPKILSGVGPTYAFVQLFQGIYDLFWLPIEHYQKDGRLIRGLQLGAQSFSARTILAALEITARLIQLLQFTAETAFDMVSSGPSIRESKKSKRGRKKRHNRPRDIREGVSNAYQILKEGINDSANNLIETAATEHDQKGLTGAVGAVMRQVPQLVVCPAVLATQATTNILGGVKSSLVPEAKLEAKEKWKDENC